MRRPAFNYRAALHDGLVSWLLFGGMHSFRLALLSVQTSIFPLYTISVVMSFMIT